MFYIFTNICQKIKKQRCIKEFVVEFSNYNIGY